MSHKYWLTSGIRTCIKCGGEWDAGNRYQLFLFFGRVLFVRKAAMGLLRATGTPAMGLLRAAGTPAMGLLRAAGTPAMGLLRATGTLAMGLLRAITCVLPIACCDLRAMTCVQ